MAQAAFSGPVISLGAVAGGQNVQPLEYSDEIGPSLSWAGLGIVLPYGPGTKDTKGQGAIRSLYMADQIPTLNQVVATGGAAITVAANASAGVPLPLVTAASLGIAPGHPVQVPSSLSASGIALGVGLDPGHAIASTVSGNPAVTVAATDIWRFYVGQYISISGSSGSGATLFTKVTAVGTTTINVSPAPGATYANASIGPVAGNPNKYGWQPNAWSQLVNAGSGLFLNPDCGATRGVGIQGTAGGSGGNFVVQGLGILMQPQSEIIAAAAGATLTYGKKTYSTILSVTPQFSNAFNYQAVTSDLFGLPLALVNDGYAPAVFSNGVPYGTPATLGFQYADFTNPATQLSADPHGAVQLSTKGPVAGVTAGAGPTGAARFTIVYQLNPAQVFMTSPTNIQALYGVIPA